MASRLALLAGVALLAASMSAFAADVSGVKFAEKTEVQGRQLALNGAGLRRKFIFKVYAMALYLPAKTDSAPSAIGAAGPKRIEIGMLRDVSAKTFSDALREGIDDNNSAAEVKAVEPQLKQLRLRPLPRL